MATQLTLNDGSLNSAGALKIKTNGTTEAVDISTGQVVTLAKDAVVNGLTVGKGAGAVSTNTAVGASALAANTTGSSNTAIGSSAGYSNQDGTSLTAVGLEAGYSNTSGSNNVFMGRQAGKYTTTSSDNTGIGTAALTANTTGASNTAVGRQALQANTTASNNTAVGYQAGYSNTTGTNNALFGYQCGYSLTTGTFNTFIGQQAAYYVTTGSRNTVIGTYNGNQGGLDIRTANNYIVLSDGDGNPRGFANANGAFKFSNSNSWQTTTSASFDFNQATTDTNTIEAINSSASPYGLFVRFSVTDPNNATNYVFGAYAQSSATYIYRIYSNGTVAARSDARFKKNIETARDGYADDLSKLRIVKYNWYNNEEGTPKELGWIAQEVEQVFPGLVQTDVAEDGTESKSVKLSVFTPMLIKAVQELNAQLKELKAEFDAYKEAHP